MKRNLLKFLFGESQIDGEISALVEDIADIDTEGASDLKVEKAPLAKALKDLGIDAEGLENDPRGLSLVFADGETYRNAHALLNTPDSLHKLAQGGWVFSTQGDVAQINEPGEWRIRFLEIATAEANDENPKPTSGTARNTKLSAVIKKAREFASKKPEHYDTNPVENDLEGSDSNKGVGDAKDGAAPEGKPKGSTNEAKTRTPTCDSCNVAVVNGVPTHEHGCPNSRKPWKYAGRDQDEDDEVTESEDASYGTSATDAVPPKDYKKQKDAALRPIRGGRKSQTELADEIAKNVAEGGHAAGCTCGFCKNKGAFGKKGKSHDEDDTVEHTENTGGDGTKTKIPFYKADIPLDNREHLGKKGGRDKVEHAFDSLETPTQIVDKLLLDCAAGMQPIPVQRPKIDYSKRLKALRKRRGETVESNPGTPPGITGHKSYPTMKIGSPDRKFVPAKGMVQAHDEGSVVNPQTKRHVK